MPTMTARAGEIHMEIVLDILLESVRPELRRELIDTLPDVRAAARTRFAALVVPAAGNGEDPDAPTLPLPFA